MTSPSTTSAWTSSGSISMMSCGVLMSPRIGGSRLAGQQPWTGPERASVGQTADCWVEDEEGAAWLHTAQKPAHLRTPPPGPRPRCVKGRRDHPPATDPHEPCLL